MADKILYYPTIDILKGTWLQSSLLYWDEIQTIAPSEAYNDPKKYGKKVIRDLVDHGLVVPNMPTEKIFSPEFEKGFLDYVNSNFTKFEQESIIKNLEKIESVKDVRGKFKPFTLLESKLGNVGEELIDRGLVKKLENGWCITIEGIAKPYMAYLASFISFTGDAAPCANSVDSIDHFSSKKVNLNECLVKQEKEIDSLTFSQLNKFRTKIVDDLLVYPDGNIPAWKLRMFKDQNGELLKNFRTEVEKFLYEIESDPTKAQDKRVSEFIKDATEEKHRIASRMRSFNLGYEGFKTTNFVTLLKPSLDILESCVSKNYDQTAYGIGEILIAAYKVTKEIGEIKKEEMSKPMAYTVAFNKKFKTYEFPARKVYGFV